MTTKLDKPLKREVELNGVAFTVTLTPQGLKVVEKGKRKGQELTWEDVIRGDIKLRAELQESLELLPEPDETQQA
jgi:hypothetical protein